MKPGDYVDFPLRKRPHFVPNAELVGRGGRRTDYYYYYYNRLLVIVVHGSVVHSLIY
jgi:hypothetical protein